MQPIHTFDDLTRHLRESGRRYRLAVVCGSDENTAAAVMRAVNEGFAHAYFVGACDAVRALPCVAAAPGHVEFIEAENAEAAARKAVLIVREGWADVLVKGLLHTATLLRAVLDKERGILPAGQVLTHIAAAEIPARRKLLFFTDAAVIPYPTDTQRAAQTAYLAELLHAFGIECPKVALLHCAETVSEKFPHTMGYAAIKERAVRGEWGRLTVDGPLDLRTALDPEGLRLKGLTSPLEGDADGLVMPDIEAGNVFYKSLPLLTGARVAGTLRGTTAPVVLPSRGDDAEAKYLSLALATMSC